MNAPVRFACANARMRAMKPELWDEERFALVKAAPARFVPAPSYDHAQNYPPLVRWYATLIEVCPPARAVLVAMFRLHEVENLKLLWRCAARGRSMPAGCWRPLAPLARLEPAPARTLASLVAGLKDTPYAHLAAETWRSHGDDLAAAELAFDGWALSAVHAAAAALPECEAAARDLLFGLLRERDLDLLRRGCDAYGLEPMFAVGLTTVLRRDHGRDALRPLAAWTPSSGTFAAVLPPALARMAGGARDWDALMAALRHGRTVACRRALMAWPFQIAPIVAAVMLREDQMRAWASLAAVERSA